MAVRWIANPFLEAYRDLLDRFPFLWVLDPSFPPYMRDFIDAMSDGDESRAVSVSRAYYQGIDSAVMRVLEGALANRSGS